MDSQLHSNAISPTAPAAQMDELTAEKAENDGASMVDVRVTGYYCWKPVIVPPNAYVVHTRRGYEKPLHIGMGIFFSYKPNKDAFLVVPATTQTIVISANTKSRSSVLRSSVSSLSSFFSKD